MERKRLTTLFMLVGGGVGSYVPLLWGVSAFSFSSLLFGAAGAILGIWVAFKLTG